jgi:hypothetical protein
MEQTRRYALENHVHRSARLGASVLVRETWYNTDASSSGGGNKDANSNAGNNNGGRDANNSGGNTGANNITCASDAICASDATCASVNNKLFRPRFWALALPGSYCQRSGKKTAAGAALAAPAIPP